MSDQLAPRVVVPVTLSDSPLGLKHMSTHKVRVLKSVLQAPPGHWVGNGFPVQTLFSYSQSGRELSPFLLLDYARPRQFPPTEKKLGVGAHPHRGFETVTVVYAGHVDHRDSAGGGGSLGPGDVQWMTAGSGLVHEEFHGREFARTGGAFEMVQLWVNLPANKKMTPPRYQSLLAKDIPTVSLKANAGSVRVIAGSFGDAKGPAKTYSPVSLLDAQLNKGATAAIDVQDGHTVALVVLSGQVKVSGQGLEEAQLAVFEREGDQVMLEAVTNVRALLISGKPILEPIAGTGPFVMNTQEELHQAISDFRMGKMGTMD
jgi:redox-sensitive bicupin YhaK (pirin superfamily)